MTDAATVRERAQATVLAADALALVIDSGLTAGAIRNVVMAEVLRRGLDDHDIHTVRTGKYEWDPTASYPLGDPQRARGGM